MIGVLDHLIDLVVALGEVSWRAPVAAQAFRQAATDLHEARRAIVEASGTMSP